MRNWQATMLGNTNGSSILKTKIGHREGHEAGRRGLEVIPLDQHSKGRHGERQACVEIRPDAVHDPLAMAHHGQHRELRLYQQAVLPRAALTPFEVGGIALRRMEAGIAQDDHLCFELANEPLEGVIRDMGSPTRPRDHQAPLLEEQTQFAPDDPAVIRETFPANLLRTAAFAHGVDELDAIGVNDPKYGRSG